MKLATFDLHVSNSFYFSQGYEQGAQACHSCQVTCSPGSAPLTELHPEARSRKQNNKEDLIGGIPQAHILPAPP